MAQHTLMGEGGMTVVEQQGRLSIDMAGHEIYYRLFGDGPETLMCLHGGPGGDSTN